MGVHSSIVIPARAGNPPPLRHSPVQQVRPPLGDVSVEVERRRPVLVHGYIQDLPGINPVRVPNRPGVIPVYPHPLPAVPVIISGEKMKLLGSLYGMGDNPLRRIGREFD